MKANEVPEKIYSISTEGGFYLTAIKPEPPFADGIEYTRTDAFVEKACIWLLTNASDYCILHNSYDTKELVKDFVDAMKRD